MTLAFVYFVPRKYDVPLNLEYHKTKFSSMLTMALGQTIVALAMKPSTASPYVRSDVYSGAVISFVVLLSMKLLIFDMDVVAQANENACGSRRSALLVVLLCQPLLCFFAQGVASGTGIVMRELHADHRSAPARILFGMRLLCGSFGGMLSTVLVASRQQRQLSVVKGSRRLS